jgi:hypothetical protein
MSSERSPLDILAGIERLLRAMHNEVPPAIPSERAIKTLVETVAKLSQPKQARAAKCPPNYIDLWKKVGANGASDLSNRAIRYLSWETDIAISSAFQAVALTPDRISTRSLQGLVRSVHRRWNATAGTSSMGNLVVAVTTYGGRNALIEKWRHGLQYVLHREGPNHFAKEIVTGGWTWEKTASEWGLEPDTEFGNQVLERCVTVAIRATSRDTERFQDHVIRTLLPSRCWNPSSFKTAVQELILASPRLSQQHSELLKNVILSDSRLQDPRLPANGPNWVGISGPARDLVIQWLSAEDIQLFFDHVLPPRSDPHGRKPFWMKYKKNIKRSRPLLAYLDETRWQANAATRGKRNFGRMEYSCDTSAFLLDFGSVMIVEFSKVGNAVYIYRHRDIPGLSELFWSSARFSLRELKQPENCIDKISHNPNWQSKMRTLLAQFGIHRGD